MSKRKWHHPEISRAERGTQAWRSVGELEKTPQFRSWMEREFPEGSGHLSEEDREVSRRNFVKLMGASSALAGFGLASCHRPEAYIVPYKKAPEWIIPGKPLYYATARPAAGGAVPVVATSFDGRPTKLEPNREHPEASGTDAFTQASVLNLYDPNRSRTFLHHGEAASREEFAAAMAAIAKAPGKVGFVFGADDCPTRDRLAAEIGKAIPEARFYSYEALAGDGRKKALADGFQTPGAGVVADFTHADRILSLDCDFAGLDPQGRARAFFERRQGGGADYRQEVDAGKMNRLYSVETMFTLTGGMADHRLRATPGEIFRIAGSIARVIQEETRDESLAQVLLSLPPVSYEKWKSDWVRQCALDLVKHKGKAAVLAGSRHHEGLHRLVLAMNAALEAYGDGKPLQAVQTGGGGYGTLEDLVADLEGGALDTVILLGPSNPAYDAPADLNFNAALKRAATSIHLGLREDATALRCTWHVPAAHFLESWADARTAAGSYLIVQPMILPLFGGVSELELLSQLLAWTDLDWAAVEKGEAEAPALVSGEGPDGTPSPALAEVRKTFADVAGEVPWKDALKNGFAAGSRYEAIAAGPKLDAAATKIAVEAALVTTSASDDALEVHFAADASVWDGRYADNSWLQEAPDPITKLTWDNAAFVSPATAKALGIYDRLVELETARALKPQIGEGEFTRAPMVVVKVDGTELELPLAVAFGHADHCVTIALGYGQEAAGLVGKGTGFNAYPLRRRDATLFATGATVTASGAKYPLAFTQEHHAMYGRALAREISTDSTHTHKSFEEQLAGVKKQGIDSHMPPNISLYKPKGSKAWEDDEAKVANLISDKKHQWGMAIDLNTCTGCSACLVACQAENNIPVVGKDQVIRGREMHWIRMDRYFAAGTPAHHGDGKDSHPDPYEEEAAANPEMITQPVACVQCESAPCETVCPVNATVHTEEGLNTMAYNRCIGTRYCANNCPYKARRFNYFDYNKRNPLIEKNLYKGPFGEKQVGTSKHLQHNPNVSVRMRGVMEKCTYCVQRLEGAKIKRKQVQREKTLAQGSSLQVEIAPEDLRVGTDSVRTACQDACPADAISFGNLLDADSRLVRAKGSHFLEGHAGSARNYDLLNYVGTRPRTSYLARVRNPNAAMPDAAFRGQATIGMT